MIPTSTFTCQSLAAKTALILDRDRRTGQRRPVSKGQENITGNKRGQSQELHVQKEGN